MGDEHEREMKQELNPHKTMSLDELKQAPSGELVYDAMDEELPSELNTGFVTKCPVPLKFAHLILRMALSGREYLNQHVYKVAHGDRKITLCCVFDDQAWIETIEY